MEPIGHIHTTSESSTSTGISCEIIEKYRGAIDRSVSVIKEINPDLVIALSRKGPRLLEILQSYGLYDSKVPILSDRAVDFLGKSEINQRRILIFDDIVVSGSTVSNTINGISARFDCDINFAAVAIDDDTIALKRSAQGQYSFRTEKGNQIPLHYAVPLNLAERYDFCSSVVRSLTALNKPYDVDFPILYTNIQSMSRSWNLAPSERHFDVTTIAQFDQGYRRSTIMDPDGNSGRAFMIALFGSNHFQPGVCKVRVYQNIVDGSTTIVPIVTFKTGREILSSCDFFCDELATMNDLVSKITQNIPEQQQPEAVFRLVTYLASYVYGYVFLGRHEQALSLDTYRLQAPNLSKQDVRYIFGLESADKISKHLADSHAKILSFADNFRKRCETDPIQPIQKPGQAISCPLFDPPRKKLYDIIQDRVSARLSSDDPISTQIATIFEAIHCLVELPSQRQVRANGLKEETVSRLKVGFSYEQLLEMAYDFGILLKEKKNSETLLSLAIDILVDDGVQIPIFYYGSNGYYERAYRHGERALNEKHFAYVVAKTFKTIFDELKSKYDSNHLRRITCEKMGVICVEELRRLGHLSALKWNLDDPIDDKLDIGHFYLRHGKVLRLTYPANENSERLAMYFNQWCVSKKILTQPHVGIEYNPIFLKELEDDVGHEPALESDVSLTRLTGMAMLLLQVDMDVDPKSQSEYLIALTTCADAESYLWALHEELVIVFDHRSTALQTSLLMLQNYLNNPSDYSKNNSKELRKRIGHADSAANDIYHKSQLRLKFCHYVEAIERYFLASDPQTQVLYGLVLREYMRELRHQRDMQLPGIVRDEMQRLEYFGAICIHFLSIMKGISGLTEAVISVTLTKSGKPDGRQVKKAKGSHTSLQERLDAWNGEVKKQLAMGLTDYPAGKLKKFRALPESHFLKFDSDEVQKFAIILLPEIKTNFRVLHEYYNFKYTQQKWLFLIDQLKKSISMHKSSGQIDSDRELTGQPEDHNVLIVLNGEEQKMRSWDISEIKESNLRKYAIFFDEQADRCWVFGEEVNLTYTTSLFAACLSSSPPNELISFEHIWSCVWPDVYKAAKAQNKGIGSYRRLLQAHIGKTLYLWGPTNRKLRDVLVPIDGKGYKLKLQPNEQALYIPKQTT